MRRIRPFAAIALAAALFVPLPAAAAIVDDTADESALTFDTPAPKNDNDDKNPGTRNPGNNNQGNNNQGNNNQGNNNQGNNNQGNNNLPAVPTTPLITLVQDAPAKVALTPTSSEISIVLPSDDEDLLAPLQLAVDKGWLKAAGFDEVELTTADSTLEALESGEADFAVVDTIDALEAFEADPSLQAVAGYQNYAGKDGAYGGSVIMAAPDLVAQEPATVSAFTKAYIRGLRKLSKTSKDADAFKPFDGGFGKRGDDGGWGELSAYAFESLDRFPDVEAFVSEHTLNVAQASTSTSPNPTTDLGGTPALSAITVGSPPNVLAGGPIQAARNEEYFESAGLTDVKFQRVEEPFLGLLQGALDIAVIDAVDAADGFAQGLPLAVIAGHRNFGTDGEFGGDVVAVSDDFLDSNGSTVTSFLTAYMRAMMDLEKDDEADEFAPFDGGFGVYDPEAGWTEFETYISEATGEDVDMEGLIASDALERARTWWGIPSLSDPDDTSADEADAEENE